MMPIMARPKKTSEKKTVQLKGNVRPTLKLMIDAFLDQFSVASSQAELMEFALTYYMDSYVFSENIVDGNLYPLHSAAKSEKELLWTNCVDLAPYRKIKKKEGRAS